jgi:excisionase family DNA binding protein
MPTSQSSEQGLLSVREAAKLLNVSECWIRRHKSELPIVRIGGLIRFDETLLRCDLACRIPREKPLRLRGESMSQVRRWQQGSVYKTGKRIKMWYGMWREDVSDPDGKVTRRQRNVKLGTVAELPTRAAARDALARKVGVSQKPKVEMNVSDLFTRWQKVASLSLKATTYEHYVNALKSYVVPVFGNCEIALIERYEVESFFATQAAKYSRSTIRSMRISLGVLLAYAVRNEWLKEDPSKGVKLPRAENCAGRRVQRKVLSPSQTNSIAEKLSEPSTLVSFLAVTGLRIGEAIAIKWSDFEDDVLHVQRRMYDGKVDTTKSRDSKRRIPIPPALLERMKTLGNTGEWIFHARGGVPLNPGNSLKRYIRPVAKELNIELGGWHDFRHTVATSMLRAGHGAKVVSELLGHSDISITLRTYDHVESDAFRAPLNEAANQWL